MNRFLSLAAALAVAWVGTATAAPRSSSPLESILSAPQATVAKGVFSLRSRIIDTAVGTDWSCRLYFDTDLNSFTGWFPSRGFEYVAGPSSSDPSQAEVCHTVLDSPDGMGGELTGYAAMGMASSTLSFNVPLSTLGPDDGRLAWELMIFNASGKWIGSYGGRILQ